jgi:hypothetical protein
MLVQRSLERLATRNEGEKKKKRKVRKTGRESKEGERFDNKEQMRAQNCLRGKERV